jgi:hypothetical protein
MDGNPSGGEVLYCVFSFPFTLCWLLYLATFGTDRSLGTFHAILALASVHLLMVVMYWCKGDEGTNAVWAKSYGRSSAAQGINYAEDMVINILWLLSLCPKSSPELSFMDTDPF